MNILRMVRSTLTILPPAGVAEQHAPLVGDAACLAGLQEHGVHELGAFVTEHDCHDHGAGGFGVVHVHAVQFCDCLGVEGGAFEVAADCERGQAHGGDGADAGHECGCAGDAADSGDVAQVGAVEALVDLFGGFVGVRFTEFFDDGQRERSLHAQYVVEGGG